MIVATANPGPGLELCHNPVVQRPQCGAGRALGVVQDVCSCDLALQREEAHQKFLPDPGEGGFHFPAGPPIHQIEKVISNPSGPLVLVWRCLPSLSASGLGSGNDYTSLIDMTLALMGQDLHIAWILGLLC